jgi:probable HAF family extracellular repeat protein
MNHRSCALRLLFAPAALFASASCLAGESATFMGLGHLPETAPGLPTYVNAVSGDGSTLVGYTWVSGSGTVPFRWTAKGGYQTLGTLGGTNSPNNNATAVSFDGSVIVGQSALPNGTVRGFRWTAETGMIELQMGPQISQTAEAVSADGLIVVGYNTVWTFPGGPRNLQTIPNLGAGTAQGHAISNNGQIVAGHSQVPGPVPHAMRWTAADGTQDLGVTTGTESVAWCISGNAQVIGGEARDAAFFWRAFRWTASDGMIDLGTLGGPMSTTHGASFDGSVLVGKSLINSQSSSLRAFIWKQETGMRNLKNVLLDAGAQGGLENWILAQANDVSDDGSVIVGWGHPAQFAPAQPFIAIIPTTKTPGDINGDGVVNVIDLLAVISAWGPCPSPPAPPACPADVFTDGVVNVADLLFVINHWG